MVKITQDIVEKYFYRLYDKNQYHIVKYKDMSEYNRVDVDWISNFEGNRETIYYNTIIQGEREEKLKQLGIG